MPTDFDRLSGLSLWLVPPRDIASKLDVIMSKKTSTFTSPSSFARFEPHITLATVPSSTPIAELAAAIPADQPAIQASFKSIDVGNKYFMSIYAVVHHSIPLETLRTSLKRALGESTVPPLSHVSLFYIDDADADERTKMAAILREEGRVVEQGEDRVALDCAASVGQTADLVDGFNGGEIWIALCDGPVHTWQIKQRIALPRT